VRTTPASEDALGNQQVESSYSSPFLPSDSKWDADVDPFEVFDLPHTEAKHEYYDATYNVAY